MLSVEDFYLRYNFSKGFIAPHGDLGSAESFTISSLACQKASLQPSLGPARSSGAARSHFQDLELKCPLLAGSLVSCPPCPPGTSSVWQDVNVQSSV